MRTEVVNTSAPHSHTYTLDNTILWIHIVLSMSQKATSNYRAVSESVLLLFHGLWTNLVKIAHLPVPTNCACCFRRFKNLHWSVSVPSEESLFYQYTPKLHHWNKWCNLWTLQLKIAAKFWIYSFNKCLLNAYHVSGSVLNSSVILAYLIFTDTLEVSSIHK